MDSSEFYAGRDDRTLRYGERRLDPSRPILITADPAFAARLDGQVAILALANLLGRMSPCVSLGFEDVPLHSQLPWRGPSLTAFALEALRSADPFGNFSARTACVGDYILHVGPQGHDWVVHGSGWNAYIGPAPSPLPPGPSDNPCGAAFAAVMAAAAIFKPQFPKAVAPKTANTLTWGTTPTDGAQFSRPDTLGSIWIVGAGSVGSAVAYFLTLIGFKFDPLLIDMDEVKVHNLDRSPTFTYGDLEKPKVDAVRRFLETAGIAAETEAASLRRSEKWQGRQAGTPDILVSAANEDDVRYDLEQGYPPLQIFGTTGKSWQSAVFSLLPGNDPCTCCVFPPEVPADTKCATDGEFESVATEHQVDAALPFLSFAAGLMAVIEIAKLSLAERPGMTNRAFFQPQSEDVVMALPIGRREGCICGSRHKSVHSEMVAGSRYRHLSQF